MKLKRLAFTAVQSTLKIYRWTRRATNYRSLRPEKEKIRRKRKNLFKKKGIKTLPRMRTTAAVSISIPTMTS